MINANTRRNPREIVVTNVYFSIEMEDKYEYILDENARLRRELAVVKQ